MTNPAITAKAGVMIRESMAANSRCVGVYVTPTSGVQFIYRTSTGAMTGVTSSTGKTAPYWVRLTRTGNTFKAFMSANGSTWTQLGKNTSIAMATQTNIGMAVTSGTTTASCTAVLTNGTTNP